MKVILSKDVDKLGKAGEVVETKSGYARNFLIPQGIARPTTAGNLRLIEEEQKLKEQRAKKELTQAEKLANKIQTISCTIAKEAGPDDKLFGAITTLDVVDALADENIKIDKHDVLLDEPIKELGIFHVEIKLHPEVTAKVKIWVVKK